MSMSLYWRPTRPVEVSFIEGAQLRQILARSYWGHDGSLTGEPTILDRSSMDYLSGLRDAGVEGAEDLIDALRRHGQIDVWIAE